MEIMKRKVKLSFCLFYEGAGIKYGGRRRQILHSPPYILLAPPYFFVKSQC